VTDHGVTLAIPPPGHGVSATADTTAGGQTLSAETAGDGTVRLRNVGSETPAETEAGAGAACADCIPPCEVPDFTFIITPVWKGPVRWSMNTARTPRPLSPAQGLATTKKSAVDIAAGANDCGLHDVTGLTTPFQGTTAKRASMDPNSESCLPKGDGVNVVEWGQLGTSPFGTTLGLTCVRWLVGAVPLGIDEFDMRLNDDDGLFTLTPGTQCSADIDLQGVTTHEWGHAVGLNHVGQGAETMFQTIERCDASRRTLALGEILALRLAY
jgi:hypothetical protein